MTRLVLRPSSMAGLLYCVVLAWPAAASAQTLAQVVITANRVPQPRADVVADVVVIDEETIARSATASLAELLQRQAGVEIAGNGGAGQPSALFLRGTNANHVVVLIDGVRINSATTGTNAIEHLSLAQIERIEVLRGPASSLYGADAVGGVIQIFTKRAEGVQARISAGSDRLRDGSVALGGRSATTEWSIGAGAQSVNAFSATNATAGPFLFDPDRDPYRHLHASARAKHSWQPGQSITAQAFGSEAVTHFDAGPGGDDLNRQRISSLALTSENQLGAAWRSTLRVARGSDTLHTEGAFPSRFATDQDQLTWQHDVKLGDGLDVQGGLEWRREAVESDTAYTQTARRIASAFGGATARLAQVHRVEASLRVDRNSQFGTRSTGRLGYAFDLGADWQLAASAGTAFHAPSFNDLYFPLSFGFSGNPNLKPERSRGGEAALRWRRGSASASVTLFDTRIDDLIAVDPSFSTVVNVKRATIRGATLAAQHAAGPWRVGGEWTVQDPRDADTDALLVRRARHHGHANASLMLASWQFGVDVAATGARFDSAANTPGTRMGGYTLADLFARWQATPVLALSARLRNAFDKRYELAQGYNTALRQFVVTLEAAGF